MTLAVDRVLPSPVPDEWDLAGIFLYAIAYGLYLTASTIVLVALILKTNFFQNKFNVQLDSVSDAANNAQLHMIVFLQVAIISQALIFVTRSHRFFFMERPSIAHVLAFCFAQLISSIGIAAYGNWGFTNIRAISAGWIGIVWVWDVDFGVPVIRSLIFFIQNIIWFIPLDWVKFGTKATFITWPCRRREAKVYAAHNAARVPLVRTYARS